MRRDEDIGGLHQRYLISEAQLLEVHHIEERSPTLASTHQTHANQQLQYIVQVVQPSIPRTEQDPEIEINKKGVSTVPSPHRYLMCAMRSQYKGTVKLVSYVTHKGQLG